MKTENFIIDVNVDIRKRSSQTLGITLMSQDINNYLFTLKLLQDGELIVMDDSYEVEVLSLFTTSKTSRLVKGTIRTHQVEWVFDTSYISKSEAVKNYVYVRKDGELLVSADANCFIFNVGLSEIDKGAGKVAEVYDESYQRYLDEFKEVADFTAIQQAEVGRESSETTRKSNETTRISNEDARKSAEVDRVNAESVRSDFYEGFDGELDILYTEVAKKANRQQEDWITPTLLNGWVSEESVTHGRLRYRKDDFNKVTLSGSISSGLATTICSLPIGYRPNGTIPIMAKKMWVHNLYDWLEIRTNGELRISNTSLPSDTRIFFEITYYAE